MSEPAPRPETPPPQRRPGRRTRRRQRPRPRTGAGGRPRARRPIPHASGRPRRRPSPRPARNGAEGADRQRARPRRRGPAGDAGECRPARAERATFARVGRLPLAASFAVLGFAAGVGLMALRLPDTSQRVADGLVSDFARAAVAGQPFDVASSDRHTVKPWLAGRTTVSADIADLAARGLPAGRRPRFGRRPRPGPTLVYRHNEHVVAVTELPLDAAGRAGRKAGRSTAITSRAGATPTSPMSRSRTWTQRRSTRSSRRCARRRGRAGARAARGERGAPAENLR